MPDGYRQALRLYTSVTRVGKFLGGPWIVKINRESRVIRLSIDAVTVRADLPFMNGMAVHGVLNPKPESI